MKHIYHLTHTHNIKLTFGIQCDIKSIGYYSQKKLAEQIIEKYKEMEGFKNARDGFKITKIPLNKFFVEQNKEAEEF